MVILDLTWQPLDGRNLITQSVFQHQRFNLIQIDSGFMLPRQSDLLTCVERIDNTGLCV